MQELICYHDLNRNNQLKSHSYKLLLHIKKKVMISGVILARNEESNIVDCVQSIRPHVSEIILIDMESTDTTIELARPIVDKILHHELIANFDSARNIAINEADNQWLWFVDADERLSDAIGNLVNNLVREQGDQFEAINIPFKTHFCGKWMEHSGWWPGYTMPRVLKKGSFRFSERLHGGVKSTGREIRVAADPNLGIEHYSYLSIEHYVEKFNRYTSTEAAQLKAGNQSIDWRNGIAHMVHDLWMYYEHNRGDLDGRHGWILAWLSGQYRWLSHAKLLDLDPASSEASAEVIPPSLDHVVDVINQELERLRRSKPKLPLGVVFHSPIWDLSGYADEGRCIAKALGYGDRKIVVEANNWNDSKCQMDRSDRAFFRSLENGKRAASNITITNCIPTLAVPDKLAAINVLRTTFETDRIPEFWLPHLDQFDEVWVISKHNQEAFIRSGVAPEKIRRLPSILDIDVYNPVGATIELPIELRDRFVFLSVFDWQLRKGWDLLLKAYCQTFSAADNVGLLLKISRANGRSLESVKDQANEVLIMIQQSLSERTDIVFLDEEYSTQQMAMLYRSVDAFVLPSRGEGWGRPYMEAMASGLPTIGTRASGNIDFMNDENSLLVSASLLDVPEEAVSEIPVYQGHKWFEPNLNELSSCMLQVFKDKKLRSSLSANAAEHIRLHHSLEAGAKHFNKAVDEAEERFKLPKLNKPDESQVKLTLEGEFFASHSFSNINEQLANLFFEDDRFAINLDRQIHNPTYDHENEKQLLFASYINSMANGETDVVIRHAFPPNWSRPESGRWIHIQPWEFGHLPQDWVAPLRDDVDEIWVPTNYVMRVYQDSGIPGEKIHVVPWGVDPEIFSISTPPRILPTKKSFRFLYVGGTIHRKGFDRVLQAFTEEFGPDEDVCLVVKDLGADTFYRYGNLRTEVLAARGNPSQPEIVYFDESWTPGQVASLYAGCDCLVMPYRGEGFGLPILEAMACGTPTIAPKGGASDDFVDEETGFLLESRVVETTHDWQLVGPALELEIDNHQLRQTMRFAFENQETVQAKGKAAAQLVASDFTWRKSKEKMCQRILAEHKPTNKNSKTPEQSNDSVVTACIRTMNNESTIADCLSRLLPFVNGILIFDEGSTDRTFAIAHEYQAKVIPRARDQLSDDELDKNVDTDWRFWIGADELVDESDACNIKPFLRAQQALTTEVAMQTSGNATDSEGAKCVAIRHFRCKR